MTTEWFYFKGDHRIGPVTLEQLKSLASSGDIEPADLVWNDGMVAPQPASTLNGTPTTTTAPVSPPLPQSSEAAHAEAPAVGADFALNAQEQIKRAGVAISTFMATAKSAAQLAAKQAEKTKLTTITLRTVYRPLGKHCYESQEYRDDFPDLFGQLDAVQNELTTLAARQTEKPSSPQSFGNKTKAMAGNVMQAAQSQKLSMQQSSLFNDLGKAVYESHQKESGPSNVTAPIAACLSRLAELDTDILRLSSEGKGSWITPKRLAIVGTVAVCLLVMVAIGKAGKVFPGASETVASRSTSLPKPTDIRSHQRDNLSATVEAGSVATAAVPTNDFTRGPNGEKIIVGNVGFATLSPHAYFEIDGKGNVISDDVYHYYLDRDGKKVLHGASSCKRYLHKQRQSGVEESLYDRGVLLSRSTYDSKRILQASYKQLPDGSYQMDEDRTLSDGSTLKMRSVLTMT